MDEILTVGDEMVGMTQFFCKGIVSVLVITSAMAEASPRTSLTLEQFVLEPSEQIDAISILL